MSQGAKALGFGRERVLVCADGQPISIPGIGRWTFYGDVATALGLVTPYRRADGVDLVEDTRVAGLQVEVEKIQRRIPPVIELLYLGFPVASQWNSVCSLSARRGIDWIVRVRMLEYAERKLLVEDCPKAPTELWFEGRIRSSFAVWDTRSCHKLEEFVETGRGIALVSPNDPEATNGHIDATPTYFLATLMRDEVLPGVPILNGVLNLRSHDAVANAVDDMVVKASKQLNAIRRLSETPMTNSVRPRSGWAATSALPALRR